MWKLTRRFIVLALAAATCAGSGLTQIAPAQDAPGSKTLGESSAHSPSAKRLGIGKEAKPEEIAGWDIDIRPDGQGLPAGKGAVKDGEALFGQRCAGCHGDFGEGVGRWPALAGGEAGGLTAERPVKTVGSYWPYVSTLIDYIRRAQPFGNPQSLSNDELYAVVAYLLFLNDIVNQDFVLTNDTFHSVRMPNRGGFYDDDRENAEKVFWNPHPCMANCKADVTITSRARLLDATAATSPP